MARIVELDHAVAFGIDDWIGKYSCAARLGVGCRQPSHQVMTMKQVVAQHQRRRAVAYKVSADMKRLRESIGTGLLGIAERQAPG